MKYAYFPGCSLSSTGIEYHLSTRLIAPYLGLELAEIPDWNCCGASAAHCTDHFLAVALPARNLALAEEMGLNIAVPCAGCYSRLRTAEAALRSPVQKAEIETALGREIKGTSRAFSLLEIVVNEVGLKTLKERVVHPLAGLKAACYYGCLLVRPPAITGFDDPENPSAMDRLMETLGAEAVDWPFKTECCGGNLAVPRTDVAMEMSFQILQMAKAAGAQAVVTACPLCMSNLDLRQKAMEEKYGVSLQLPVFYFTELIGLALGIAPQLLGIYRHYTDPRPLLAEMERVFKEQEEARREKQRAENSGAAKENKDNKNKNKNKNANGERGERE